jgi:uncharacterized delta-60 repeat protein
MLPHLRAFARRRRRTVVATAMVLGGIAVTTGCSLVLGFEDTTLRTDSDEAGTTEGGTDTEGGTRPDGGTSRLTTKPASIVVRRGASAEITIELARGSDVTATVTAGLSDLPAGITATTVTLAPAATSGKITITAAATATLGLATVTLSADDATLAPAQVPLLVADPPGALDTTFDGDGLVADPSRGDGSTFLALAVQADARIVAGGGIAAGPGALSGWMIRRYAGNGVPDTAFNTLASAPGVMPGDGQLDGMTLDAKGNIVCVGITQAAPLQQLTVARLLPTGALDPSFANGIVRLGPDMGAAATFGFGVAVQPDGAVVVVGSRRELAGNKESGIIVRFTEKGARDPTFNGGQTVVVPGARFVGVAVQPDGAIVAAGSAVAGAPSYLVVRRTPQGDVDPTYGTAGSLAFGPGYRASAFTRLADGSVGVAGDVQQGAAGYTAGAASAKGAAIFARTYASTAGAGFFGLAAQPDGRLVAAGHTATANGEARVERILPDGNKDTTFGTAGTAIIDAAGTAGFDVRLFAAAVQADGRVLAAGNRTDSGAVIYRMWP